MALRPTAQVDALTKQFAQVGAAGLAQTVRRLGPAF